MFERGGRARPRRPGSAARASLRGLATADRPSVETRPEVATCRGRSSASITPRTGIEGFVTISGGKTTTARAMAETTTRRRLREARRHGGVSDPRCSAPLVSAVLRCLTELRLRLWRTAREGRSRAGYEELEVPVGAGDRLGPRRDRAGLGRGRPSLVFRHACHHGSCGTCTVRVDGRERLPCITPLADVWDGRRVLTIEPLRGVPLIADLAIDPTGAHRPDGRRAVPLRPGGRGRSPLSGRRDRQRAGCRRRGRRNASRTASNASPASRRALSRPVRPSTSARPCSRPPSACSRSRATRTSNRVLDLVDTDHGVWQCRSAWACSAVCPNGRRSGRSDHGPAAPAC